MFTDVCATDDKKGAGIIVLASTNKKNKQNYEKKKYVSKITRRNYH